MDFHKHYQGNRGGCEERGWERERERRNGGREGARFDVCFAGGNIRSAVDMKSVQHLKNTDSEFLCYWSLTVKQRGIWPWCCKSDLRIEHLAPHNDVYDSLNDSLNRLIKIYYRNTEKDRNYYVPGQIPYKYLQKESNFRIELDTFWHP